MDCHRKAGGLAGSHEPASTSFSVMARRKVPLIPRYEPATIGAAASALMKSEQVLK